MHRQVTHVTQPALGLGALLLDPVFAPAALGLLAVGTSLDVLASTHPGGLTCLAFWLMVAGVAGSAWCALFALLDWIFFARAPGQVVAWGAGGIATALVVGLYGLSALLRAGSPAHAPTEAAFALEVAGAAVLCAKSWVGRSVAAWLDGQV